MGNGLLQCNLQRVVFLVAVCFDARNLAFGRIKIRLQCRVAGKVRRRDHGSVRQQLFLQVGLRNHQVVILLTDVGRLQGCGVAELFLHGKIPLLGNRWPEIGIPQPKSSRCERICLRLYRQISLIQRRTWISEGCVVGVLFH